MFNKKLQDLTYQDLEDLVYIQQVGEGYNLDFKGEPKNIDEFSNKLLKIFSSFANTNGGYIIIGVEEIDKQQKGFEIRGINPAINNKNAVEWINQTINGNLEPKVFYYDPKVIEIPDTDKIAVIYQIPESSKKPHFNNRDCKYYIRQNDSSEAAKHHTIRDMFEFSRHRTEELRNFLIKRNLFNENDEDFGLTNISKQIKTEEFTAEIAVPQPLFLASFIPKYLNQDVSKVQKRDFVNWLEQNSRGYPPIPNYSVISTTKKEYSLDGVTFRSYNQSSYFDFLNNGFFEVGLCDSLFCNFEEKWEKQLVYCLHITFTAGYIINLLHFMKKFYEYINYDDEVILQLSFRNVLNFHIEGFNQTKGRREWRNYRDIPKNKNHNHFKILHYFTPSSLNDDSISLITQELCEKILLGFGINDSTACFIENNIDVNTYSHIRHI